MTRIIFHGPYGSIDRQTIPTWVTITLAQGDSASVTLPKEPRYTRRRTCGHTLTHPEVGGSWMSAALFSWCPFKRAPWWSQWSPWWVFFCRKEHWRVEATCSWKLELAPVWGFLGRWELTWSFPLGKIGWSLYLRGFTSELQNTDHGLCFEKENFPQKFCLMTKVVTQDVQLHHPMVFSGF